MAELLVRYFAAAVEAAGVEEERIEATTAEQLRGLLVERHGARMARVLERGSLLADGVVTRDPATVLVARVDVLPPFAGG